MPTWPDSPRLLTKDYPRLDGMGKASGKTKYPSDVHPDGLLFGVMMYSPYAHARIVSIDISEAEKVPGVKGIHLITQEGQELTYHGDEIAAIAAETEEQALDGLRAIKVEYEVLPHAVTEEQSLADDAPRITERGNTQPGRAQTTGDPDTALGEAAVTIEGTYSVPVVTHVCLEPHGLTARWENDNKITAWASTQAVAAVAGELGDTMEVPVSNVTVLTEVMGGGFGSKFGADVWGVAAAQLSKKTGKPVRMFLDRTHEHLSAGNRPSATGKVQLGADQDGKIVALIAETHGTGGISRGASFPLPYVYGIPNHRRQHTDVRVNCGNARAMRAPGHPEGCAIMESAIDDLAEKMGIDPLEMRLKSLADPDNVPSAAGRPISRAEIYREQIKLGAREIGWDNRKSREENRKANDTVKRGLGMALHQWGGRGVAGRQVTTIINPDGSVEIRSATQDIGTGTRTIMAMIAAEVLGLMPEDINSNIGNSTFPPGQGSGGSTTAPSMSPATLLSVTMAKDQLLKRIAPGLNATPEELTLRDGIVLVKGEREVPWAEACRKMGMNSISVTPEPTEQDYLDRTTAQGVGGVQFADLTVDVETGVVRLKKIVAVQDTGLIVDLLLWKSQVLGGVIGGLNYGLFEERVMDPTLGVMLNADMEHYKLAGATDIPEIICIPHDTAEMRARGVIGVGEPPTIGTGAAIGNAVANAIGVRVPNFPMSPMNILNALAAAKA